MRWLEAFIFRVSVRQSLARLQVDDTITITRKYEPEVIYGTTYLVSAPDPNQPQRGSLPVSRAGRLRVILEVIRAGVGLGLGPRLRRTMTDRQTDKQTDRQMKLTLRSLFTLTPTTTTGFGMGS